MEILKFSISEAYRQHLWDWGHGTNINNFGFLIKEKKTSIYRSENPLIKFSYSESCHDTQHQEPSHLSTLFLYFSFSSFIQTNLCKNAPIGIYYYRNTAWLEISLNLSWFWKIIAANNNLLPDRFPPPPAPTLSIPRQQQHFHYTNTLTSLNMKIKWMGENF